MSYLHGLYLDSFQTTKRHSYDGYSIHIAIFNSFLQGVYPVGVTDLRPYFTQIICHNSMNVHRVPTKVGTEIRLNEPFKCAKFQDGLDVNCHFVCCVQQSLIFLFKMLNDYFNLDHSNFFTFSHNTQTRGHAYKLLKPLPTFHVW